MIGQKLKVRIIYFLIYSICCYIQLFTDPQQCAESYVIRTIVAMLPAYFRMAQCLRRFRDTKEAFPHLANAGKDFD